MQPEPEQAQIQQQILAQKDEMEYQMQLEHHHQHPHHHHHHHHHPHPHPHPHPHSPSDMEADQSLLQRLPSLSNKSNGLTKMDGIYMSDLTMKRGMAPSASGSSLASSDATSRGSVSYDGDEMEIQGDHDFEDSFSSQTTSGSMGASGLVAGVGGSQDGSTMEEDKNNTSPSPSKGQATPSFFNQYSMSSNSTHLNRDAGVTNHSSPITLYQSSSTSPTSKSRPFLASPNDLSNNNQLGPFFSERRICDSTPQVSASSMVSLSPRDMTTNLRSSSVASPSSQHSQLQSFGEGYDSPNANTSFSSNGAAIGNQINQHRPSLGESLGLTLGQQAPESSPASKAMMQQAVAEHSFISGGSVSMSNVSSSIFSHNSFSGSKTRPGPPAKLSLPPLNFFQDVKSGIPSNPPFTPGGSLFYGARDGAATGEPLSPFEPPTPLKRISADGKQDPNPMDSPLNRYAKLPSIGSSMGSIGEGNASPTAHAHALSRLQRKRPSLPPALGGMNAVRRASYSPNSSYGSYSVGGIPPFSSIHQQHQHEQEQQSPPIPISPLRQEFASVNVECSGTSAPGSNGIDQVQSEGTLDEHMRTLTRSSIDVVMGLRQLNEEAATAAISSSGSYDGHAAHSAASSPSTLSAGSMSTTATSNFTPPCSPLAISSALSSTKQKQRSPSPMQASVEMRRASNGTKSRAKEVLVGSSSNAAGQSHSMTTRAKKSAAAPHSVKSRSVSPPAPEAAFNEVSNSIREAVSMPSSAPPTQTSFGCGINVNPPKATQASSQAGTTLSPPTESKPIPMLRAVPMSKSKSAPIPASTVSARHLSTRTLDPRFVSSYDLGDELGSGGFGFVVSAKRRRDGMPVAVKFIWKNKVPSHGWVRDPELGIVPMEIFVLKVVDSPFVVKFIEAFDDSEFFYLVMEHHGTPWVANTKENKAAAAAVAQGKGISEPPAAPTMQSSKSLPGSSAYSAVATKSFNGTTPSESPTVAVFPPNSNIPSLTCDSEMLDNGNDSRSSTSSAAAEGDSTAPSRPGMPQRRLSCDLFECIEQHSRLTESRARWVFAQVVEAVYHLDRMGISHRDIKDENCVIDADFNVKLIDFGSAVISDVRKPAPYFNRFFGTMTFASAEILQGKMYRAPNAEVWSLGVLLSILLSGECPFEDPKAAMAGRIGVGKGWSREAKELISGCLDVDPDRRANVGEVREHPWVKRAWKEQGRDRPL